MLEHRASGEIAPHLAGLDVKPIDNLRIGEQAVSPEQKQEQACCVVQATH
jgi:hypothetical protein